MDAPPTIVIGLTGRKTAGKTFCAGRIQTALENLGFTVTRGSFAAKVKEYAKELDAGNWPYFEDALRDEPNKDALITALKELMDDPRAYEVEESSGKRRFLLQHLGTEIFRCMARDSYWVDLLKQEIDVCGTDYFVIDDTRFPNEATICNVVIRVLGPRNVEQTGDEHQSETLCDSLHADFVIDNSMRGEPLCMIND